MPPQSQPSIYQWGQLIDYVRRTRANSVAVSPSDQLMIARKVSAFAYDVYPWPFTLETTTIGQIPCMNLVQDYAQPDDVYRLTRAWFNIPNFNQGANYGTVPPYDDPSNEALIAAEASATYVGSIGGGGGAPAAYTWPTSGSFDVVKRLGVNLSPMAYTGIRAICQMPNTPVVRLDAATAVSDSLRYSLELEYQPIRAAVNSLTEQCWFPDSYLSIATEGIAYELYTANNDPRAGGTSYSGNGNVNYNGQLAAWMAALSAAAGAEREGSVNNIIPGSPIGNSGFGGAYSWFA